MRYRRGFTFVEMSISMVIIAMIGLAISGFVMSVSTQWKQTNQQQMLQNTGEKAQVSIGSIIESARMLGVVSSSTKVQMLLWYSDSINGSEDGVVQLGELGLIEYDSTLQSIMLYRGDLTISHDATSTATYVVESGDFTSASVAEYLKKQAWLLPARSLLGPGRAVTSDTSATLVTAAEFTAQTGTNRNGVKTIMKIMRESERSTIENRYIVRGAMAARATPNGSTTVSTVAASAVQ